MDVVLQVHTVYPGPFGGAIVTCKDCEGTRWTVKASTSVLPHVPSKGEVWRVSGDTYQHPEFGEQIEAKRLTVLPPAGAFLLNTLKFHQEFRGIGLGHKKIQKLSEEFGPDLPSVLTNGDLEALTHVLSENVADALLKAWERMSWEMGAITFLDSLGLDLRFAKKIYAFYGVETESKIKENVYRLLAFSSWKKVDACAVALGVEKHDERRLVAAVEAVLYERLDQGHTAIHMDELALRLTGLIGSADLLRKALPLAAKASAVVALTDSCMIQAIGPALMEDELETWINDHLHHQDQQLSLFQDHSSKDQLDQFFSSFEAKEGFSLTPEQKQATVMAATEPLSLVMGGAGVGKTTVLKAIYELAGSLCTPVFQMALSGRAAQRMREATGQEAYTIMGFITAISRDKLEVPEDSLVVIDEASMLCLQMMLKLIQSLPNRVKLVLVGDHYQLPPVGFGLVFQPLIHSGEIPSVELTEVYRQEHTGLLSAAASVRHGQVPTIEDYDKADCGISFLECSPQNMIQEIERVTNQIGMLGQDVQILSMTKQKGPACVNLINRYFHENNPSNKVVGGWNFSEGDPVIFTRNDYQRELFNGCLGCIDEVVWNKNSCVLNCTFEGVQHTLHQDDLSDIDLAYAITVHKAQGSEFQRVIIPIYKSMVLDRTLLYTALTRAKKQVVFIGDRKVASEAILGFPRALQRDIGLKV
jgi:ATP-dependent exoDNAse (exonuclease V), alpha subunit - helicase superfamily I member